MGLRFILFLQFFGLINLSSCHSPKSTNNPSALKQQDFNFYVKKFKEGGRILIPSGHFFLNSSVIIDQPNTKVIGAGMNKTKITFAPGAGIEIRANDVEIAHLHLTGTYKQDGNEQHSLNIRGPYSGIHIDHVKVSMGDDTGIRIGYALRRGVRAVANNCKITNCLIENINEGSGIEIMGARNITVENNQIRNVYQNGIRVAGGKDCIIKGNVIENYNMQNVRYAYGIYAKGGNTKAGYDYCNNIKIVNNSISGRTKNISLGTQTSNIEINDNDLILQNPESGIGITLENNLNGAEFGYRNIHILNNRFKGEYKSGIEIHTRDNDPAISGQNVKINNNNFSNYSRFAIYVRGNNFGEIKEIFVFDNFFGKKENTDTSPAIIISKCKEIFIRNNEYANHDRQEEIKLIKGSKITTDW